MQNVRAAENGIFERSFSCWPVPHPFVPVLAKSGASTYAAVATSPPAAQSAAHPLLSMTSKAMSQHREAPIKPRFPRYA
jgi:hypothetical protein